MKTTKFKSGLTRKHLKDGTIIDSFKTWDGFNIMTETDFAQYFTSDMKNTLDDMVEQQTKYCGIIGMEETVAQMFYDDIIISDHNEHHINLVLKKENVLKFIERRIYD